MKKFRQKYFLLGLVVAIFGFIGCNKDSRFGEIYEPTPPPKLPLKTFTKALAIDEMSVGGNKLDVLWVIDNSGSMGPYQKGVKDGTSAFMTEFSKQQSLDWKMGLISTGISDETYLGFESEFNWRSINPVLTFQNAVSDLGISSQDNEATFDPTLKALTDFPNFLRRNAYLALIMVTDEPEQSTVNDETAFLAALKVLKENTKLILTYGVFLKNFGSGDPSGAYMKFIQDTNGQTYDLRSSDYGVLLAKIGSDLVSRVSTVNPFVSLPERPVVATIQLKFNGRILPPGQKDQGGYWIYEQQNNVIRFTNVEIFTPTDRNVEITYEPMAEYE